MAEQGQAARDDPGVATVLPGPTDQYHAIEPVIEHFADRIGRASPGVLHEHEADDPELVHRDAIDLA